MRHHILVKFKPEVENKEALYPEIRDLFAQSMNLPGVWGVSVHPNVTDRSNRYDLMIVISMEKDALPGYDDSEMHHHWKEQYGSLLEKKAIFDCDD